MSPPPVSHELVRRIARVSTEFTASWLARAGRVRVRRFGDALAVANPALPDLDFQNRVGALTPADAGLVPDVVAWYAELCVRPWFEVVPAADFDALAGALSAAGAAQIGFWTMLYGETSVVSPPPGGVSVRRVGIEDAALFGSLRARGLEIAPEHRDTVAADAALWPGIDGWWTYVAEVDRRPAGAGTLVVQDGIGYLADASTVPECRGRGVQSALIARRVDDAAGCDVVASLCAFGSQSHRNLQRAGLQVACTMATWRVGRGGGSA